MFSRLRRRVEEDQGRGATSIIWILVFFVPFWLVLMDSGVAMFTALKNQQALSACTENLAEAIQSRWERMTPAEQTAVGARDIAIAHGEAFWQRDLCGTRTINVPLNGGWSPQSRGNTLVIGSQRFIYQFFTDGMTVQATQTADINTYLLGNNSRDLSATRVASVYAYQDK